jgi:dsRNA-specific ribonuclease
MIRIKREPMTLKEKEYLGDAILEFLAREYVILSYDGCYKYITGNLVSHIVCNKTLARIANKIGIVQRNHPFVKGKGLADEIEIILFEIYDEKGMAEARRWFYNNIVPNISEK